MAFGVLLSVICLFFAERLPAPSVELSVAGPHVGSVDLGRSEVLSIRSSRGELRLLPVDLIEEPDVLPSWRAVDDFFARQGQLWTILHGEELAVLTSTGETPGSWHPIEARRRDWRELPLAFYVQVFDAFLALLIGMTTFAYSDRGPGARYYAISAVGFAIALWPVAIYSTRSLALEPTVFHWLSTLDHFGAHILCLGLCMMMANYPRRVFPRAYWLWILVPLFLIPDHLRLGPKELTGFHTGNLVIFGSFVALSFLQWRACRADPIARATLRWTFLSIMIGVTLFVTLFSVPILLDYPLVVSQSVALTAVVLTYAGMSLGVLRVGLFRLDVWWLRVWTWILGGVAIVATDVVLVQAFSVEQSDALLATLLVLGVVYFPLRQWLLTRVGASGTGEPSYDVSKLASARNLEELDERFVQTLTEMFSPLKLLSHEARCDDVVLDRHGAELTLPMPGGQTAVTCTFRDHGANLFRSEDIGRARELLVMGRSLGRALIAREQGQVDERNRIRRDLHDDLGPSLARIARHADDERVARLAKTAMADLRDVLTALKQDEVDVARLLLELEADCRERAGGEGRDICWERMGDASVMLGARQHANLVRVFREATTNALHHGEGTIVYRIVTDEPELRVVIKNRVAPSASSPSELSGGQGLTNIATRLEELGGTIERRVENGEFVLELTVPYQVTADGE